MVKYTRENIEGIIFSCGTSKYKIIKSLPEMHLKSLTSNWESFFYTDPDYILRSLNNNTYTVIEQPIKIYELW